MQPRCGKLVENGGGINGTRCQRRTCSSGENGLGCEVLKEDIEGGRCAGPLIDPSKADGNQIVPERIFRGWQNASIKDGQVGLGCGAGHGAHDESEILLSSTSVKHFEDVIG